MCYFKCECVVKNVGQEDERRIIEATARFIYFFAIIQINVLVLFKLNESINNVTSARLRLTHFLRMCRRQKKNERRKVLSEAEGKPCHCQLKISITLSH